MDTNLFCGLEYHDAHRLIPAQHRRRKHGDTDVNRKTKLLNRLQDLWLFEVLHNPRTRLLLGDQQPNKCFGDGSTYIG